MARERDRERMARTVVIAGVGPGLGASLAHRFAEEGCDLGLLARTESYIEGLAADISAGPGEAIAVPTDLREPAEIRAAFDEVRETFGPVDVLINHASGGSWVGIDEATTEDLDRAYEIGVRGGFCCAKEVVPRMRERGEGTIIFTGATSGVRGREGAVAFSSAKFGVRGMAQSLARELGPEGIQVSHVVLDGGIRPPEGDVEEPEAYLDPDDIAERYWHLATGDTATMAFEVHLTNGASGAIEFV